jgi:hypothetical protein
VNSDSGAIVLGWLTRLVVVFAVLGVLAYDGVSVVVAHVHVADKATQIASSAADTYKTGKSVQQAYEQAEADAQADGDSIKPQDFVVLPTGTVQITLHRVAVTLWMQRIGPLKHLTDVAGKGQGIPFS